MKHYFLLIFISIFLFSACEKEEIEDTTPEVSIPEFSMDLDGLKWNASLYYYDKSNLDNTVIYATNGDITVSWLLEGEAIVKSYELGINEKLLLSSMYEKQHGSFIYYDVLSGELVISEYDITNQIIKGTFNFNVKANSIEKSIKNGVFHIDKFK